MFKKEFGAPFGVPLDMVASFENRSVIIIGITYLGGGWLVESVTLLDAPVDVLQNP